MTEQPVRHTADTITDTALDELYAERERYRLAWTSARSRAGGARIAWRCWFRLAEKRRTRAEQAEAAIARVREVLAPRSWPYAEVRARDLRRALDGPPTSPETPPKHLAKGTNAEDCPACEGTNPDYPFLCPGPETP